MADLAADERDRWDEWDERASVDGLYSVLSRRWSAEECIDVNRGQRDHVLGLLPPIAGLRVLDLGCGVGRVSKWTSEAAGATVAVDRSFAMAQRASREVEHAAIAQASVGALPIRTGSFDVVLAIFVLQHVLDEDVFRAALTEIGRVVRPGGWVVSIDGIDAVRRQSATSSGTVVRTLEDYGPLHAACDLVRQSPHKVVEDNYTSLLWRAR